MKILIVEDDKVTLKTMVELLKDYGKVDTAENGREAIKFFLRAVREKRRYNLVFLDIVMPEMNGQRVLKKIRSIEEKNEIDKEKRTKVVMTTAMTDPKNITDAFRSHCESYLIKPVMKENIAKELSLLGFTDKPTK
ncbi:response regulator [bacterium]|nr:response regulator [bacterium]